MVKKIIRKKSIKREVGILVVLVIALIAINYSTVDNFLEKFFNTRQTVNVERIIDGDTLEAHNQSIRLLGINTPERGEFLYQEAKDFLEAETLNKKVTLEFIGDRYDKYGRLLAYVLLDEENINVRMVENGLANYYFYSGKDRYSDDLINAWYQCIASEVNLCKKSTDICSQCVNINGDGDFILNNCFFSCNITNWQARGEGREKFIFSEKTLSPNEKAYFALDLTNTGGSLFLRDDEGKLVDWEAA